MSAIRAIGAPGARVEQAEVVVDFRGSGDGRPRVAGRIFLFDRNGRSNARNFIHVRLFDSFEELARIGRERLDVAPLAFRINCVKRQARLSRPGNPSDQGYGVVRNIEADVFQVMNARSSHTDRVLFRDTCHRPRYHLLRGAEFSFGHATPLPGASDGTGLNLKLYVVVGKRAIRLWRARDAARGLDPRI